MDDRLRAGTASAAAASNGGSRQPQRGPSNSGGGGGILKQPARAVVDLADLSAFLRRPVPAASAGMVMCCIERIKAGMGKAPM